MSLPFFVAGWFVKCHVVGGSVVRISMSDSFVSSWKVKRPATAPGAVVFVVVGVVEFEVVAFEGEVEVVFDIMRARMRREAWRRFFSRFSISEVDWNVGRRVVRRVRWERLVELSVAGWACMLGACHHRRVYVTGCGE